MVEWRKRAQRAADAARRAFYKEKQPGFCGKCRRKLSPLLIDGGYKTCSACRLQRRKREQAAAHEKAHALYVEKIALARAERLIAAREAEKKARIEAAERAYEKRYGREEPASDTPAFEI
jgi:hypothetical protein